jgi:hypothetical protein
MSFGALPPRDYCRHTVDSSKGGKLRVVALTSAGKRLVEAERKALPEGNQSSQRIYADMKKPAEIAHDAAIYQMFQAEAGRIRSSGGKVRRVVLDYELKQRVYRPLARARLLPSEEYEHRRAGIARDNGLEVVDGKIPLPDLRIEYETREGEIAKVDLELATDHYKRSQLAQKKRAGFRMYMAGSRSSRTSTVWEDRELTAGILSI